MAGDCTGLAVVQRQCLRAVPGEADEVRPVSLVDVDWGLEDALYPVDVQIDAYDRSGLLRDITWVLANEKVNVIALNTQSDLEKSTARLRFSVEVGDIAQLSRLLDKLSQLRNVIAVQRYTQ